MNLQPAVKWTGSKRSQAERIASFIEHDYDAYYEPFCGGCSMMYYILNAFPERFRCYRCSDVNAPLIGIYRLIMDDWRFISTEYGRMWNELNKDGDLERKKRYFNSIREEFNRTHRSELLFFIMRTTTNGMPRYNGDGEFNNSFHVTRNGMTPDRVDAILSEWSRILNAYDVRFDVRSYEDTIPGENDLCYFDPPYFNTKGIYFGGIDCEAFYGYLRKLPCDYMFSFDGVSGDCDNTADVPRDVYDRHEMIRNGNSSFKRVIGNSRDSIVYESLYLKGDFKDGGTMMNPLEPEQSFLF